MKTCSKCGVEKDEGEFRKKSRQCKKCLLAWYREYRSRPEVKEKERQNYERWISKPGVRERVNEKSKLRMREQYANDAAYRQKILERNKMPDVMKRKNALRNEALRVATPEMREQWREKKRCAYRRDKARLVLTSRANRHGMTAEQLAWLLESRGNRCEICHRPAHAVDHSHAIYDVNLSSGMTKQDAHRDSVRGLLCDGCNVIIGRYENGCRPPGGVKQYDTYLHQQRPFAVNAPLSNVLQLPLAIETDAT